mmetsp:Transcript_43326/g.85514  ORF Transcript_43326/g.85514 Transcript_43326/m.85514 type:complete len:126 (+) Transcript_43326:646-1023(+)
MRGEKMSVCLSVLSPVCLSQPNGACRTSFVPIPTATGLGPFRFMVPQCNLSPSVSLFLFRPVLHGTGGEQQVFLSPSSPHLLTNFFTSFDHSLSATHTTEMGALIRKLKGHGETNKEINQTTTSS